MNTPLTGPRAYSPAAPISAPHSGSKPPADKTGAEFKLDLERAVTPAEWRALAETFGAPAASGAPAVPATRSTPAGEVRGRHVDIRA